MVAWDQGSGGVERGWLSRGIRDFWSNGTVLCISHDGDLLYNSMCLPKLAELYTEYGDFYYM